jgi:hypothetical protein
MRLIGLLLMANMRREDITSEIRCGRLETKSPLGVESGRNIYVAVWVR